MNNQRSSPMKTYHNVHEWAVDDVRRWLTEKGFDAGIGELFELHKIDGKALLSLNEDDLRKHPLKLSCLGEIKKLYMSISQLQTINVAFTDTSRFYKSPSNSYLDLNHINYTQLKEQLKIELQNESIKASPPTNHKRLHGYHSREDRETDISSVPEELSEPDEENDFNIRKLLPNGKYQEFKPEAWKALVAMLYFFVVTLITAVTMVIVHDRVPDMGKYPPLPDIFLDNMPLIPFAFVMCELCGLILFLMSILLLVFHKHRFILIRRMFSLFGSVFLLRCFTMLITSLSVPGRHLNCQARPYGDWMDKLKQAFVIWQGGGMSIQGVRTCGDYMFSGHTVTLTLLNFFLTEYTPQSLYFVHTLSWVLNLFGVFFILAGHEHYSIDVFIAFYISTRLFLYYHTLANNRCLYMGDRRRTRIWFPLFYFFESGVNGIVPNEFELPFKSWLLKLKCSPNRSPNRSPNGSLLNGLNGQLNGSSNQILSQSRESSSSNLLKDSFKECKPNGVKHQNSNSANSSHQNEPSNSSLSKTSTRGSGKRKNKKNK